MMWATRVYGTEDWSDIRDTVEEQFSKLGAPRSMMLVLTSPEPGRWQLWMSLPSELMLPFYPGFEQVTAPLPSEPRLLVGNVAEFRRLFGIDGAGSSEG